MSSKIDWPGLMQAGLVGLGLKPAEFWALTPAELQLMLGQSVTRSGLAREGLQALMDAFPDHEERRGT